MFSLCIPTMDRYDTFLSKNLPRYLSNPLIGEIIITDENGRDADKIVQNHNSPKLKVYKNECRHGPFVNKLKAMSLAQHEWIAIIDSDNFADDDYFVRAQDYLSSIEPTEWTILAPSFARPNFDFRHLEGKILNKVSAVQLWNDFKTEQRNNFHVLMNTGNYIIRRNLIQNINLDREHDNIMMSPSCDVIFFNTLLFEQFDLEIHVVPGMYYNHVVHPGSIYTLTHQMYANFNAYVHQRFHDTLSKALM